jgi:hypothetical protein
VLSFHGGTEGAGVENKSIGFGEQISAETNILEK